MSGKRRNIMFSRQNILNSKSIKETLFIAVALLFAVSFSTLAISTQVGAAPSDGVNCEQYQDEVDDFAECNAAAKILADQKAVDDAAAADEAAAAGEVQGESTTAPTGGADTGAGGSSSSVSAFALVGVLASMGLLSYAAVQYKKN